MMHYSLLSSDVKTLIGTNSVTLTAMNDALAGRLPRNFYVAENMHGRQSERKYLLYRNC